MLNMKKGHVKANNEQFAKAFKEAQLNEATLPPRANNEGDAEKFERALNVYFEAADFASTKDECQMLFEKLWPLYKTHLDLVYRQLVSDDSMFNPIKILKLLKIRDFEEAQRILRPLLCELESPMRLDFAFWWQKSAEGILDDIESGLHAAFSLFEVTNMLHEWGQEFLQDLKLYRANVCLKAMEVTNRALKKASKGTRLSEEFGLKRKEFEAKRIQALELCEKTEFPVLLSLDEFLNELKFEILYKSRDSLKKKMEMLMSRYKPQNSYDKKKLQKSSPNETLQLMLQIYNPENQVRRDREWTMKCKYITRFVEELMLLSKHETFVKSIFTEDTADGEKFLLDSVTDVYAKKEATAIVKSVTAEQREKSEYLVESLHKTTKVAFNQLQSLAANSGCKLILEEESEADPQSSSNIDSFVEIFMKEDSEDSSWSPNTKLQAEFSLPFVATTANEDFYRDDGEMFMKKNIIATTSNYFNCDKVEDVQVRINEKFHVQVVVRNDSEAMQEKFTNFAEKSSDVACYKIRNVNQEQMACFKLRPTDFDPDKDFVFTSEEYEEFEIGGVKYIQPNKHWVHIALNTKNRGYESDEWLQNWTYGFHGSDLTGNREIANQRQIKTRQEKEGGRQKHENDIDVNEVSDRKGQKCGEGVYFAEDVREAYLYTLSKLREGMNGRYCVFEVRIHPSKTRIPKQNPRYRIVNETEYARPTGILVLVDEAHLSDIGMVAKERLCEGGVSSTDPNHEPARYFLPQKVDKKEVANKLQFNQIPSLIQPTEGRRKVILIVGPSQSGKTTFLNGLLNHLLEIQFEDKIRFEIETDRKGFSVYPGAVQQVSSLPTEWISSYSFQSYKDTFTFVDTPGYGSSNIENDTQLDSRILKFFKEEVDGHSLDNVDAICFVQSAQSPKLTSYGKYVTERILSIFGKNVERKLFLISTCCSYNQGPLNEDNRYVCEFKFENDSLYANNNMEQDEKRAAVKRQWDFNKGNYTLLLEYVSHLQNDSDLTLDNTVAVLQKRLAVEQTISDLQQRVRDSLFKGTNLEKVREKFMETSENIIQVVIPKSIRVDKPPKNFATNCLVCVQTCHDNCGIDIPGDMYMCKAMDKSMALSNRTCSGCGCHWRLHRNEAHFYIVEQEVIEKSLADYQKEFGVEADTENTDEKVKTWMAKAVEEERTEMLRKVAEVKTFLEELGNLALVPVVANMTDYIEQLMKKENAEKNFGYEDRLKELEKARERAELIQKIPNLTLDQILSELDKQSTVE